MSWARRKVGELGGLYAPRQAPSGGIGDLRWCFFPPARDPRQTPKTTVKPHQGEWGDLRWCSFHPGARPPGTPHGGTVHPRRHGTPMAARYTHGGTVHPWRHGTPHGSTAHHGGGAREKPSPRGGRAPALLRYPLKACCHAPLRAPTMQGAQRGELEWIKSSCFAPSRAPTTQGEQSSASWKA